MLSLLSAKGGDVSGLARADEVKRPQVREKATAAPLVPACAPPEKPLRARRGRRRTLGACCRADAISISAGTC